MKELVCIECPNSCFLKINVKENDIEVIGYRCKRGIEFAKQETFSPKRILTTTVKTSFSDYPVISVKTNKEIDKSLIFKVIEIINKHQVNKVVNIGDCIISNVLNTNVDIVATTSIE